MRHPPAGPAAASATGQAARDRSAAPSALSIAGSDPSGGAGIQADLKTFAALGVYGMAVVTALTAQNTRGVTAVVTVEPAFVTSQLDTLLDDITPGAVKIGMLATAATAAAVGDLLMRHPDLPVVLDPVMVATSGDRLLDADAVGAVAALISRADLVTPNLGEAALLTGTVRADGPAAMQHQAELLRDRCGARRVLVKGGHLDGDATDVYLDDRGPRRIVSRRVDTTNTHGTGCTLSSAVAARVACGSPWLEAVRCAKEWLTGALDHAGRLGIGSGTGPVDHLWQQGGTRP